MQLQVKKMGLDHLNVDVLVVGSGAAGLRGAIAASEEGAKVCVLSKGPPGLGTSTVLSYGILAGAQEEGSSESHRKRTIQAGRGINQQELVDVLVEEAPMRLQELLRWGIHAVALQGCLFAEGRPLVWGEEIVRCLMIRARTLGIQFLGGLTVCRILVRGGMVGSLAYSSVGNRWIVFCSRSLVLAAGGAGALYLRHDNPGQMLGEGYILALDAGAVLQDMEFVQFHPGGLAEPGLPRILIPSSLMDRGLVVNSRGQEILAKYGLRGGSASKQARDFLSQALYQEIQKENEEVWLDLRSVTEDEWTEDPVSASIRDVLWKRYGVRDRPLRVSPITHHVMGGVRIDPDGATSVPGLFAAGEVTGGLHGANRMRGNALTETLVFGARAGNSAARWVKNGLQAIGEKEMLEEFQAFLSSVRPGDKSRSPADLKRRLRKTLWENAGVVRTRQGLERALADTEGISEEARHLSFGDGAGAIHQTLMLQLAARTALLIVKTALKREESRGAHFREDFPAQDDERWRGHLLISLHREGERWSFEPVSKKNSVKF